MTTLPARQQNALPAKMAQLRRRRHQLAEQIKVELQRPAPCSAALKHLKRQRLRLKDQIAYYTGLLTRQGRDSMQVSS